VAKKVTAIVFGASVAMAGIPYLFTDSTRTLSPVGGGFFVAGVVLGTFSLIALAVMALIDYARRPRS